MAVYPDEQYIVATINKCIQVFYANKPGPISYLKMYNEYFYILDGSAKLDLDKFFAMDPAPYLKVIK